MRISYCNRQNYLHIRNFISLKIWLKEELVGWEKVRVWYIECENMTKWESPFQSTSDKLSGRMQDCEIVRVREHDIVTVSKYVIRCTCYKVSTSLEKLTNFLSKVLGFSLQKFYSAPQRTYLKRRKNTFKRCPQVKIAFTSSQ